MSLKMKHNLVYSNSVSWLNKDKISNKISGRRPLLARPFKTVITKQRLYSSIRLVIIFILEYNIRPIYASIRVRMGKIKRIWRGMMVMMTIQHDSHPPIFSMHACMYHHHVCVMDVMFMHKACQEDEGETKETTCKYTKARKCGCGASELCTEVFRMRMYTCTYAE